jgi:hypothetical protein
MANVFLEFLEKGKIRAGWGEKQGPPPRAEKEMRL